ncbi:hypothetical protein [Bradyrhizobium sp.]|uniref:hypothetical protein n=1 Tax=Bradyrhizobium sp. TaxID=376 RepID=UPI00403799CF
MSQTTDKLPTDVAVSSGATSRWKSARLTLFYYFMFAGIFLDIYFAWYAFRFEAECSASGNNIPGTFPLLTALSAIPAAASIIFGRNSLYKSACLNLWILYCGLTLEMNCEQILIERQIGINCYRDLWGSAVVTIIFAAYFAVAIVAITLAIGLVVLARRYLLKDWPKKHAALA